jgi:hypothetical protein
MVFLPESGRRSPLLLILVEIGESTSDDFRFLPFGGWFAAGQVLEKAVCRGTPSLAQ